MMDKIRSIGIYTFSGIGLAAVLLIATGAVADIRAIDPTSGAYDPPYTSYSGNPIDWNSNFITEDGMYSPGYVIDTHVDCTTGMISFDVMGIRFDYRELSPRALAIHDPRQACAERGFDPQF